MDRRNGQAPAIEAQGLSKAFGGVLALSDVEMSVAPGEIHALVGQNGAGKSTLLRILAGVTRPDSGRVEVKGHETRIRTPKDARRYGIRMIHQELNLMPDMTVAENTFLGGEPRGRLAMIDRRAMRRRTAAILERLGSQIDPMALVSDLPIQDQQIVEIGKALAADAEILILDEPTAALEPSHVRRLFEVLGRFRDGGGAALYVSHRLDEIFELADRLTVLRDGRLAMSSPTSESSRAAVIQAMIGRELTQIFPERGRGVHRTGAARLELENVSGGSLRAATMAVHRGELLGISGVEGSGMRDLPRVIIGDLPITNGQLRVDGRPLRVGNPRGALRQGVVYVTSDRRREGLFAILNTSANIAISTLEARARWGFVDEPAERETVNDLIERLRISPPDPDREARLLSGGNQQKALLARNLATEPTVFIFDEPTRGIDVGSRAEIYAMMRRIVDDGAAVIMISSDQTEVLGLADRILAMRRGAVATELQGGVEERELLDAIL